MTFTNTLKCGRGRLVMAVCAAVLLASGCGDRRSEQKRGAGDVQLKLGNIAEARASYEGSLEINPNNAMAKLGLARCAAQDQDLDGALDWFEKARANDPALAEAYVEPVRLLLAAGRAPDALALADRYREAAPESGGLLYSAVLLEMGRPDEAVVVLEALKNAHPASMEVSLNLGVAYAEARRPADAEGEFRALAQGTSPVAAAAQMALIEVYQQQGKTADMLSEFEKLRESQPDNPQVDLAYARALVSAGRVEEGEKIARAILAKEPDSGWANYIVGAAMLEQGKRTEALAFLESAAAALPEEEAIGQLIAQVKAPDSQDSRRTAAAPVTRPAESGAGADNWRTLWKEAALRRLLENRDAILLEGGAEARETLAVAAVFMEQGALARELAGALPDDSKVAEFLRFLEAGDARATTDFFDGWRPEEPEQTLLRDNALGYALARYGSRGQAIAIFLFCLERWPENGVALFNIAQVFRALGQPGVAALQLQRLVVTYPENIDAHQMLYAALREGGDTDQARRAAESSFALFPEERWAFLNLSQSYLDTGDIPLAGQVLERAQSLFSGDPEIDLARASLRVREGDCAAARQVLDGIQTAAPTIATGRALLRALCAAQARDWTAAAEAAQGLDRKLWPESVALVAYASRAQAGELETARGYLAGADGKPAGGMLGRMLHAAAGGSGDGLGDAEQEWAAYLAADNALLADYAVMSALQRARLYDAAWEYHQEHFAERPAHIALIQLALASLAGANRVEDAPGAARALVEQLEGDARAWLGLAALLRERGDEAGEADAIKRALAAGPENPEAWYRNAILQERQSDFAGAVESYRKIMALQPENPVASNNLAYMLLRAGGSDQEALEHASFAHEKLRGNPGVLHTLGLAQMRAGDLEASRRSLGIAAEIDPSNPTILYDFGRVLLEIGEKDSARQRLQTALGLHERAGITFPEQADAKSLLGSIE
ncbi:MAG: tetratricopeptide repeat protein [Candidatus Hydrogenedentes bacterium]|nr:tetratricopeptide repeat protein [Candidatus Hydrogenedentota bacterium]